MADRVNTAATRARQLQRREQRGHVPALAAVHFVVWSMARLGSGTPGLRWHGFKHDVLVCVGDILSLPVITPTVWLLKEASIPRVPLAPLLLLLISVINSFLWGAALNVIWMCFRGQRSR